MADQDDPFLASLAADPPRLGPLAVSTHREQVATLPWLAGITLAPARATDVLYDVAVPTVRRSHDLIGLELRKPNGELVSSVPPKANHDEHARYLKADLDAARPRRTLVDLSPLVPVHFEPGDYVAVVSFSGGDAPMLQATSEPLPIRFTAPTPAQRAERDTLVRSRNARGSWLAAFDPPTEPAVATWQLHPLDPFAWLRLAALSVHDPAAFARLPQQAFSGFPLALAPEVTILNVQWLLANRRGHEAAELAASARANYPGIERQLRALGV